MTDKMFERECGNYLSRTSTFNSTGLKEIWDLYKNDKIPTAHKIVLGTTFDKVLVKAENIDSIIEAFEEFENDFPDQTNIKDQIECIKKFKKKERFGAIGWNQTSVNGDTWANFNYNEETEENESYNYLEQNEHWFLFEVDE